MIHMGNRITAICRYTQKKQYKCKKMWILNSMQLIITLIKQKVQKSLQGVKCTGHANSKQ